MGRSPHNADTRARPTLGREAAMAPLQQLMPFVTLVVQCSKGQYVEEEQRRTHCYSHTELRRIVPRVAREREAFRRVFGTFKVRVRRISRNRGVASRACAWTLGRALPARPVRATRWQSCGYGADDLLMQGVEVRHQLKPEGNFVGTVIVPDARLQPDVEVLLVFRAELGPDNFFKAIGLSMDELGILWHWNVRITGKKVETKSEENKRTEEENGIYILVTFKHNFSTDRTLTPSWRSWSSTSSLQH